MNLHIIFQNEHFVVVDKPAGVLTTPPRFQDGRPILGRMLEQELGTQIFPVHRLDYEVSGLVLYALNSRAHSEANTEFENRRVQKTYQALSEFGASGPAVTKAISVTDLKMNEWMDWKCKVLKGKKRTFESPHGQNSWTKARCDGRDGDLLKWTLMPVTGRSHQLRFDLARHGFPIVGDVLYGAKPARENEISLRSISLEFENQEWKKKFGVPAKFAVPPIF